MIAVSLLFFTKDIACDPENCHFLEMPEIIQDICDGYCKNFNAKLHDTVTGLLKPCIVKFVSDQNTDIELLQDVFYYIYLIDQEKGKESPNFITSFNTFDAEGCLIPLKNILKIDFLP